MPRLISHLSQVAQVFKSGTRSLATVASTTSTTTKKSSNTSKKESSEPIIKPSYPQKLYTLIQKSIAKGEPHFKVGGKKLYFPTARIVLLRPNAKHTPYQAKFIVPKSFNKMDLRDYLYHLYGIRAFKITTQLIAGKYTREGAIARHRTPQIKKMTVDLMDPFIWPEEPEKKKEDFNIGFMEEIRQYGEDSRRLGSDRMKPGVAFNGELGPYPRKPEPFVPKFLKKNLVNEKNRTRAKSDRADNEKLISQYLGL